MIFIFFYILFYIFYIYFIYYLNIPKEDDFESLDGQASYKPWYNSARRFNHKIMSKMWNSHIHFHLLSYLFVGSKYYKEHRITVTKYIHSNQPSLPLPTNTNSAVLFCFHMNVALRLESQLEALTRRINCLLGACK